MSTQDNRVIAKNTLFLYIRLIFILLVSLYTTRVVLNVLGIEDYGIYNVVAGFVSLFSFLNSSMSSSIQRFYNYKKGKEGRDGMVVVFNTSLIIQIVILIVTLLLLETFGVWYINNKMIISTERLLATNWLFQFSVLNLLLVILQIPFVGAVIACEKMDFYALVGIVDVILKLIVVIVLPQVSVDKLIFYGASLTLSGFVTLIMYVIYSKLRFDFIRIKFSCYNGNLFKEMVSLTGWTILDTVAYILKGQGLNVLLNAFCGPVVNAARGIAYQVSNALSGFQSNLITAFKPQLIQSYAKNEHNRVIELMHSSSKLSYLLLCSFSIPIIIEIDYILSIWLKGTIPDYTIPFTIIVLINMTVSSLNTPLSVTILAVGRIRNYQIIRNAITMSVLPFSWIIMKNGADPIAVFIISFIITLIVHPISMILLHKEYPYSYKEYCKNVLTPCIVFSLLSPIIPLILKELIPTGFLRLCVVTVISVVCSSILSYFVVFNKNEKRFFRDRIVKILPKLEK